MSAETAQEIAEILGGVAAQPRGQIAQVIDVLGEPTAFELLAETQRVEDSGGMMVSDRDFGLEGGGATVRSSIVFWRRFNRSRKEAGPDDLSVICGVYG